MAAIALLDLLRRNPNFGGQTFNSRGLFSTKLVGASTAAAASFAITTPFAFGALFGNGVTRVAYCDAGAALGEDYISSIRTASGQIFQNDALKYSTKQYDIQLKPLFSAFHWKTFALTSLRSFLLFYLPLLEPHSRMEDEAAMTIFYRKILNVVTTRRVLERLAVHYASQRMAWKLLKDVPKSATRKAVRKLPTTTYCFCVCRTTFRGHLLGVLASWIVQVGIDIYRLLSSLSKARVDGSDTVDAKEQVELFGKKVYGATVRCCASLIFASIGAGIGATLISPSTGQWIGSSKGSSNIGSFMGSSMFSFVYK
ncbi:hypothetical protein DH2020_025722 [Rehmannia glutinosa]|uniref:Uncharacterized protein n=1 Tax=Rehmannia glutinosa TaxID=99300 RepID=A0ABR0W2W0_REHGL